VFCVGSWSLPLHGPEVVRVGCVNSRPVRAW
jgi:hypothetical protein